MTCGRCGITHWDPHKGITWRDGRGWLAMSGYSKIEWTDTTWNPITGCTKVSEGCQNCYAERMAKRLAGRFGYPEKPDQFDVTVHPDKFNEPLSWRKARRVFVCSMGDLFHPDVPFEVIHTLWGIMEESHRRNGSIFQVLTKRPDRMQEFVLAYLAQRRPINGPYYEVLDCIWLGCSVENQARADERLSMLLSTQAAIRFVSVEPMLGPIDLRHVQTSEFEIDALRGRSYEKLDWVIVGGESGPGARPMHPDWVRDVRDQCIDAGVPFFFKQWGEYRPSKDGLGWYRAGKSTAGRLLDGREWNEFPE